MTSPPPGWRDAPVQVVDYDPTWPAQFAAEAEALRAVIGPWATGGIHHVGSTAVPGLAAKPIIDILVGVDSLEASTECIELVAPLHYVHAPYRVDEMHWFCKPDPAARTHHLHLVPTDSPRFINETTFPAYLRKHPERAAEYAELKRDLAERFRHDREAYTSGKSDFIRKTLRLAHN